MARHAGSVSAPSGALPRLRRSEASRRAAAGLLAWLALAPWLPACGDDGASPSAGAGGAAAGSAAGTSAGSAAGTSAGSAAGSAGSAAGSAGSAAGAAAGTAATDAGTDSGGPAADVPGASVEEIGAFLDAESYRNPPWISETDAPREPGLASPHDRVRVWLNETLVASFGAGNGVDLDAPAHLTGSMAVKEFYDAQDTVIGRAAMLKLDGDRRVWAYYCDGSEERCDNNGPPPVFGIENGPSCTFCHSGLIFTQPPQP